jgi:hypothetical protein
VSGASLGAAMAALTAALQASPGLSGATVTGNAPSAASDPDFVVVGHDGTMEADGSLAETTQAGTFASEFITSGNPPEQEETGTVNMVAVSQTGDTADLANRVTRAQQLLAAVDDATTDLRSGQIVFDGPGGGTLVTRQDARGCAAILAFTVTYSAPW